jgi:DNA modification methylase
MKPYYEHAGITIYLGDCREILPTLGTFDLLLTDPPYGISADRDRNSQENGWRDYGSSGWDKKRASDEDVLACVSRAKKAIVWGGNYFRLPPSMGWMIWDKGQRWFSLADAELAWTSSSCATRVFDFSRARMKEDFREHPTQKPEELMRWCIVNREPSLSILDPYMGSGTTLRAAKDLGKTAVGIDREERYCEIAARRLQQEVLSL